MRPMSFSRIFSLIVLFSLLMALLSSCSTSAPQAPVSEPPAAGNNQPASENTQAPEPTAQATNTPAPSPVPPTPTPQLLPLSLSEPVVFQSKGELREVFYVFYIENPNPDYGVESATYSIAFLDADGKELRVEQDLLLPCLFPGQKIGITGRVVLEDGTATKAQITLSDEIVSVARSELQAVMDKPITVDNLKVSHFFGDFKNALGVVTNPLDVDLSSPEVYFVAYDSAGQIVGSGNAYVGFVLPNDSSGFSATIMAPEETDRIETYPVVFNFKDLLVSNTPPEGADPPIMGNIGYGKNKFGNYIAGVIFTNPNSKHEVREKLLLVAYGPDGSVVGVDSSSVILPPGATMGVSRMVLLPSEAEVVRVDLKYFPSRYKEADAVPEFPYTINTIEAGGSGQTITGEINNPTANEFSNLFVHAIAYNELGQIIGATGTRIESLPANGKADIEIEFVLESPPAKVELYPEPDL